MIKRIKSLFSKTKTSLLTFNNEPFSRFSILLIIMLDVFLLMTIIKGIDSEQKMSPNVYQKFPSECQNHFNPKYTRKEWDTTLGTAISFEDKFPFKNYGSFEQYNTQAYYYTDKAINPSTDKRVSLTCRELNKKIAVFAETKEFKNNRKLLLKLRNEKRNTFAEINRIEQRYNTKLFEKTANETRGGITKTKKTYYKLIEKEKSIDEQISSIKKVSSYKGYSEYVAFIKKHRADFKTELLNYKFWQPFISFLYLLKFTLPLLLFSLLLYRINNKLNRKQTVPMKLLNLISSHTILISIVPIFINLMYLIYHIIPHRFLEGVIKFLYKFGMMFLGYYFLMFLGIAFFGAFIFIIQKNLSKREKLRREIKEKTLYIDAYNEKRCPVCRNRVDYNKNYCGYCKEKINRECGECGADTPNNIKHCLNCGEEKTISK